MSDLNNINSISKKLADYFQSLGISEERVIELINLGLNNQVGKLTNLKTNDKSLIVNAINELLNVDLIGSLEDRLEDIEEVINTIKQNLIDKLVANGIKEQLSINDDWEKLINHIEWFNKYNYKDKNIYKFTVSRIDTIVLQNDLRGDTFTGTVYTDWGDGTINTELSHTYTTAGTYTVVSKYNVTAFVHTTTYKYDANTVNCLIDVLNINKSMTDASHLFNGCNNLTVINANDWDTSNITLMDYMFANCTNLITLNNENWNVSNVTSAAHMTSNCPKLK
jgi:surface protein